MSVLSIKYNRYELVYLTFAFDSMLKFQAGGFRVHIGILAILVLTILDLVFQPHRFQVLKFIKTHWSIFPFCFYLLLNAFLNWSYPGIATTLFYYLIGLWVFYFFFLNYRRISIDTIKIFQWVLVLSGLLQHILLHGFGYQLAFFNPEHYQYDGSFAVRLRGFFMEPNWYAISLSFNTLYLILKEGRAVVQNRVLLGLTLLCALFNGSYTFVGVLLLGLLLRSFLDLPRIKIKRILVFSLVIIAFLGMYLTRSFVRGDARTNTKTVQVAFNYGSRFFPAVRTIGFMSNKSVTKQLFGVGVGSWPYVGLEQHRLGYIGSTTGQYIIKPGQRDSAEFQVFLLELGYLGVFLFLFDYIYLYWKYKRSSFVLSISAAFLFSVFFIYPIFKFAMYLVPYYLIRSNVVSEFEQR